MKRLYVFTVFSVCTFAGSAQAGTVLNQPESRPKITLEELMNPGKSSTERVPHLRERMLEEAGKTVGFQGGWITRSSEWLTSIDRSEEKLDGIFQFSTLLNDKGALPPVIVEAQDVSSFSDDQIRTASRVYRIVQEERFVSVPPTWRDYLFTGLAVIARLETPRSEVLPENEAEQEIWERAVKSGWELGIKQTDRIVSANMNRLVRDYVGMLRSSILLQKGMVTQMEVAESQQTVSGNKKEIVIGDTHRRMTKKAEFETDPDKWEPAIAKSRTIIRNRVHGTTR